MKKFYTLIFFVLSLIYAQAQPETTIPWAMFHGCEKHCGVYPANPYKNFGDEKWKFKTEGKIFSSPAVLNGVAYIGSEDKNLYAIDVATGKLIWKFKTDGAVHSSPAVYKNVVYFGSFDGYYYAVDTNTGKEKWKVKTKGEHWIGGKGYWGMKPEDEYMEDPWDFFLSSPIIDKNDVDPVVYFGSSDGNLFAVSAKDGFVKWKFKTNGIIHTSPSLYNGVVYIGSWDTYLYAVDAKTGKERWKFKTGDQPMMSGILASVAVGNDRVYFGARDANFYCLKAETGDLIWKYNAEGSWIIGTAGIKDSVVYVGTSDSFLLLGLDAKSGKEKFRFKTKGYVFSSPAIVGNTAFFGDFTGNLFALDLTNGNESHEFMTAARKKNANKILNEAGNLDFQFAAKERDLSLYKTTVDVMNEFYSLGSIVSSPAVQQGVVYFGSADGYLYAVNLKEESSLEPQHHHH